MTETHLRYTRNLMMYRIGHVPAQASASFGEAVPTI
jgi:hypothetical protein